VRQRGPGTHLVVVPWSRYRWVLAAAPGYLQRAVSRDEPVPVYIPAWAETLPTSLAAGFARQNVSPLFQMVESSEAAKTAAQAQVGIACVPVYTARLELAAGELRRCLEGVAFPPTSIDAIHRRPAENPMVATFVSFLRMLRSHPAMRQILLSAGDARIQAARAEIPSPVLTRRQHTRVG
ncbi:MAG: LysR substrate-binding domain-containing protein, partial [Dehalococcoidia bacterium]